MATGKPPALTSTPEWKALQSHYDTTGSSLQIRDLFSDKDRFNNLHFCLKNDKDEGDFLVDFSKNRVTKETLGLLLSLARARGVEAARDRMYRGEKINFTENRAVLHIALRNRSNTPIHVDGADVMPLVSSVAMIEWDWNFESWTIEL